MKEKLENLNIGKVFYDVDVKPFNTFRVSAKASSLVIPDSLESLVTLLDFLKNQNVKYKIIGKCSNLVFVNDYEGVLIRLDNFSKLETNSNKIVVGAGASLIEISINLSKQGYKGIEFASGIPGTIGGGIIQNAGCYGSSMSNIVKSVKVLNPEGKVEEFQNEQLEFNYRDSYLKGKDYIILEAELYLEKGNAVEIMDSIAAKREKRLASQPLEYPSAGSVFRNPNEKPAWQYIEELGFKGKQIGGAKVSNKHANFIINTGTATGKDIKELILEIQEAAKQKYGIDLIYEQELVE